MIIAIDETGSFSANSGELQFFTAVHMRQRKTLYKLKQRQFFVWESKLPSTLKNPKGEIKSSSLSDEQLFEFAKMVIGKKPLIRITPLAINPADNSVTKIEKYRSVMLIGINEGVNGYKALGREIDSKIYEEFANWFKKLNYAQFLKIYMLGDCIAEALVNTVGHSVTGKYDNELPRTRYLIDRDFIREPRHNSFWHELLRNQIYHASKKNPLPLLRKWREKGHPFLTKYMKNGRLNLNELFWKRLEFVPSHTVFEIRIADAVNTIFTRYFNRNMCKKAYKLVKQLICKDGRVHKIILEDFDLESYRYNPDDNPWRLSPEELSESDNN